MAASPFDVSLGKVGYVALSMCVVDILNLT